jgi:hypothetical protein
MGNFQKISGKFPEIVIATHVIRLVVSSVGEPSVFVA